MPDGRSSQSQTEKRTAGGLGELQLVPVDQIARNERNPRQTFDPRTIERLAASLEDIGLQVPITVYRGKARSGKPYVLLDGERRFKAAMQLNWPKIPALVVPKPSFKENAVRMFNIHMLREDWREIETTWALEQIIEETGITSDRELQKITGLSVDRIRNMRRVLSFPRAVQEKVADGETPFQLLVELDKSVLSKQRHDSKESSNPVITSMTVAQVRDTFLKKYKDAVEKDVVDLRRVGTLFDTARSSGKVAERARAALRKLVGDPAATIEEAYEVGAASSVELSKVLRDIAVLPGRISDLLDSNLDQDQRREVGSAVAALIRDLQRLQGGASQA